MNQTFGRVKRQITREPIAVQAETTANKKATTRKADGAPCRALRSSLKARLLAAEGPWSADPAAAHVESLVTSLDSHGGKNGVGYDAIHKRSKIRRSGFSPGFQVVLA